MIIKNNVLKQIEDKDVIDGVITIPDNVKSIEYRVFYNRDDIVKVNLPDGIETIDEFLFFRCSNLKFINLPKSLKTIEEKAFFGCKKLILTQIPDSVSSIGFDAFSGCSSIETIKLPSNLKTIKEGTFANCSSLTSVSLPENLEKIEKNAFFRCTSLNKIHIPENVDSIGSSAFLGCSSLKEVNLPQKISTIESETFNSCISLENVIFPNNLKSIGEGAFFDCQKLTEIKMPDSIDNIENLAFYNCINLKNIYVSQNLQNIGVSAFNNCISLTNIEFPQSIKYIQDEAFKNCINIEKAIIPENVEYLGKEVFAGCTKMQEAELLCKDITSLHESVFCDCKSLKNIKLNDELMSIGKNCFKNCTSLTSIILPQKLSSIGEHSFENCGLFEIIIPKSVQEISNFAFFKCENLESVQLPNGISTLNHGLFQCCSKLNKINIPESVESVGNYTFGMCSSLKEIKFPEGFKKIGAGAFYNCSELENISLPSSTTHVFQQPFEYCSKLKTVHFPSGLKFIGSIRSPFKFFKKCNDGFNLTQNEGIDSIPLENIKINLALLSRFWDKKTTLLNEQKNKNICDFYNEFLIEQPDKVVNDFINNHNFTFFKQLNIPNVPENRYELFNFLFNFGVMTVPVEKNGKKIDYAQKTTGIILEKTRKEICDLTSLKKMFLSMKTEGFKPEFTEFFMQNFDDLVGFEELIPGFTSWCYNEFEKVQKTNTSNRGSQRQLKPTIEAFFNYFSNKEFIGINEENQPIADAISLFFKEQDVFDTALMIDNERKSLKVPNNILGYHLKEDPFAQIDKLEEQTKQMQVGFLQDMVSIATNEFTFDWLEKNDPQNFILGKLCTCCAHIKGGGYGIMHASIIDPNVQNLVIKNDDGQIIAKSTLYINPKERYGVFNNIEVSDYVDEEFFPLIYQKFMLGAKTFAEEYNKKYPYKSLRQINVGMNLNDLTTELHKHSEKSKILFKAIDYSKYGIKNALYNGDSDVEQFIVWKNDEKGPKTNISEMGKD